MTTRRCLNDIDFETTWINVVTATMLNGGKIPMYMENDRDALMLAIRTCNGIDFAKPRIVHVLDTLHLDEIALSETYLDTIAGIPEIEVLSDPYELKFDAEGFLLTDW